MSYDEWDARQEEYYDSMLQEFYQEHGPEIATEAIDGFQTERLQSYFTDNPALIEPAVRQLAQRPLRGPEQAANRLHRRPASRRLSGARSHRRRDANVDGGDAQVR